MFFRSGHICPKCGKELRIGEPLEFLYKYLDEEEWIQCSVQSECDLYRKELTEQIAIHRHAHCDLFKHYQDMFKSSKVRKMRLV